MDDIELTDKDRKLVAIAHYYPVWLPGTMTWLNQLVNDIPAYCNNVVICEQTTHPAQTGRYKVFNFSELSVFRRYTQRFLKKSGILKALPYYTSVLQMERVDLLHSHFGHIAVQGCKIAEDAGIRHVASFYGLDLHQVPGSDPRWKYRYQEMFSQTNRIFCEGEFMAKTIEGLGCPPQKITVHPLGIDLDNIAFHPTEWNREEPLRILMAASFREKKGIPLALQAVAAIRKDHPVVVTLIGDSSSDRASINEKKRILETIQQLKLEEITDLRGYLPHDAFLQEARNHHIFLSPSIHAQDGDCEGGAPVGIIEMSAAGMIVVSSTHCDIPGVIRHGETGWLAEENNLEDLIAKLSDAINNHDKWHTMAESARNHIATHFDSRKQARKLYNHYQEVLGE